MQHIYTILLIIFLAIAFELALAVCVGWFLSDRSKFGARPAIQPGRMDEYDEYDYESYHGGLAALDSGKP